MNKRGDHARMKNVTKKKKTARPGNTCVVNQITRTDVSFVLIIVCGLVAFMLIGSLGLSGSCTVFTASAGDTVLFGNNEDVGDKDATVWFIPATETTYGWVYFGFRDYPTRNGHFPMGGMNDQGLCFDITSIPATIRPLPETIEEALQFIEQYNLSFPRTFNAGAFGERILENCATVEEALQVIEQYDLLFYGEHQFLFADRTGDSMILCPSPDGEMKVVRKEGVYQVITNFNVLNPGLGHYPCRRYDNAVWMLKEIEREDDLTVEYFTLILKETHSGGTTYSTIYDPVNGVVYLYNHHNFNWVVVFDVKDELEEGYHSYEVPSLLQKRGEPPPTQQEESEEPPASSPNILYAVFAIVLIVVVVTLLWKRRENRGIN